MVFKNRSDAGKQLAPLLNAYKNHKNAAVLGLARGGMVVAYEVARELHLPLDVIIVRKIGAPGNEELAMGATTEKGDALFNRDVIDLLRISEDALQKALEREKKLAQQRANLYRKNHPALDLKDKIVILVDDGIATGASMRVAIHAAKAQKAKKIILAIPVAAPESLDEIRKEVDEVHCLSSPSDFAAVGMFYRDFPQTSDEEVSSLLDKAK